VTVAKLKALLLACSAKRQSIGITYRIILLAEFLFSREIVQRFFPVSNHVTFYDQEDSLSTLNLCYHKRLGTKPRKRRRSDCTRSVTRLVRLIYPFRQGRLEGAVCDIPKMARSAEPGPRVHQIPWAPADGIAAGEITQKSKM